jgi:PAS domain S-box-containing protein
LRKYVKDCLAAELALRIDQAFDRERLRVLTEKLSERTNDLAEAKLRPQALIDAGLRLARETDPARLLDRLCSDARDLIASSYSMVAISSEDQHSVVHISTAGLAVNPREIRFSPDHQVFTSVMESRRPRRGLNPTGDPALLGLPATFRPFQSFLVAPIVSPSRAYGWLCLFDRLGAAEFSGEDERLAGALSAFVGRLHESNRAARLHAEELEREVARRRRAEDEAARLSGMVQSSDDAIIDMALDGNILGWNAGAVGLFGYSAQEIRGKPIALLFADPAAGHLDEALQFLREGRSVPRFETAGRTQAGESLEMAVSMSPLFNVDGGLSGASAIVRDVTTQRQLAQQLLIAEKMSAVGRLSAGTAHDFNNLLAVIRDLHRCFSSGGRRRMRNTRNSSKSTGPWNERQRSLANCSPSVAGRLRRPA